MKRSLVVLLVALLCLQLPGIAQKTPKAKVGITAGASLSNLVGKIDGRETRYDSKGGFCTGILVDVPLGKTRIGFRPELSYMQKGAIISKTKEQTLSWATRYAEFDFNFVYHTKGAKGLSIFAGLGPALGLNLPSKVVTKTRTAKTEDNLLMDKESPALLRGIDWGATGVAGLQLKDRWLLGFYYNHGIRNLVPGKNPTDEIRNSTFSVKLGVLINNGK